MVNLSPLGNWKRAKFLKPVFITTPRDENMVLIEELPEHNRIIIQLENYFKSLETVIRIFLSGSSARNTMDQYSDIDVGVVIDSDDNLNSIWENRWKWDLPK